MEKNLESNGTKKKIAIVGNDLKVYKFFKKYFDTDIVPSEEEADIIVFTGGEDVTPSLYGQERHLYTNTNLSRDLTEVEVFSNNKNKKKIGICRG